MTLFLPLSEPQAAEGQKRCSDNGQGYKLMPQHIYPDSLEEDSSDDDEKVADGIGIGDDLDNPGHVGDGKDKSREENHGQKEEEVSHHGLLLGLRDGGDEEPKSQCAEEVD